MAALTERVYAEPIYRVFVHEPNGRLHSFYTEADSQRDALNAATGYPDGTTFTAIRLCIPADDLDAAIESGF